MDDVTATKLKRGFAKGMFSIGIFLLVTGTVGYITASSEPVEHATRDQLVLLGLGALFAAVGRLLPRWLG
jgi:hypothetical protein